MNDPTVIAAWIAASVAIVATILGLISQITFWILSRRDKRKEYELERRREALEKALKVIDHYLLNLKWDGKDLVPHDWYLSDVHDAMNAMFIYCKNPGRGVELLFRIFGKDHNTMIELSEFRKYVCRELGTDEPNYDDPERIWVGGVKGATKIRNN